jgi:protocatechuate 3,4-dioxygenase beta subunit
VNKKDQLLMPDPSRRRTLILLGSAVLGTAAYTEVAGGSDVASAMPACVVTPKQTEGPFFIDKRLERSDIRVDPANGMVLAGTPLALTLRVHRVGRSACLPMPGVIVDVWHCDANGQYSGVAQGRDGTAKDSFLRGYQASDSDGAVRFMTIYPGWYPGRAVHIHFKVRTASSGNRTSEFTSQLYFDDGITDIVHAGGVYRRRGRRDVLNAEDGLFSHDDGASLLIKPTKTTDGYAANFDIGLRA